MSSAIGQVLAWTVLLNIVLALDGRLACALLINRRYGGQPKLKPIVTYEQSWQNSDDRHQINRQMPRYLDIGFGSSQQLDSDLLFPDPALFKAQLQESSSQQVNEASVKQPHVQSYNDKYHYYHHQMASSVNNPVAYKSKYPVWNYLQYEQHVGTTVSPVVGQASCCSGAGGISDWNPLKNDAAPMMSSASSSTKVSLYLPVAVSSAESELLTQMKFPAQDDHVASTTTAVMPATLLIPVPRENATNAEIVTNGTGIVNDEPPAVIAVTSGPPPQVPLETIPITVSVPAAAATTQGTVVHQQVISTPKPVRNPTTRARPAAAPTEKPKPKPKPEAEAEAKPKPKPKPEPSKPASDDQPQNSPASSQPVQMSPGFQPPANPPPFPPPGNPIFQGGNPIPGNDPFFPVPPSPIEDIIAEEPPSGVPGDLPLFEDGGGIAAADEAAAAPASGEESPFPGLFSEFLNQVADMIEEFQPTTEVPLADEAVGETDPLSGGNFNDAGSNFGQESVLSGSAMDNVDGFPNGGGDFGAADGNPGVVADDDVGGGQPNNLGGETGGFQMGASSGVTNENVANDPVPLGVPNDPGVADASNSGSQFESSNSVGQQATASPSPAVSGTTPVVQPASDPIVAEPPLPNAAAAAAQYSSSNGEALPPPPSYANDDYGPPPIASEPQIHPPIVNDYVDPMMIPYGSLPMPQISASLTSGGSFSQQQPPSLSPPEVMGEFHHREQSATNAPINHNGNEEVAQSEENQQQQQQQQQHYYEGSVSPSAIYEHASTNGAEYDQPTDVLDEQTLPPAGSYLAVYDENNYGNGSYVNETAEYQPLLPVANHLEVHVSQSVWPSSVEPYPIMVTTVAPSVDQTYLPTQNDGLIVDQTSSAMPSDVNLVTSTPSGKAMTSWPLLHRDERPVEEHFIKEEDTTSWSDTSTVREYLPTRHVPHSSNYLDDNVEEDPQPESVSSVNYSAVVNEEDEAADAEGIPSELLPEVEANINIELKKMDNNRHTM